MKHPLSGFCASGLHDHCPGMVRNGLNVALGLDTKSNPTRAPREFAFCGCKRCNHYPQERAVQDAAVTAFRSERVA